MKKIFSFFIFLLVFCNSYKSITTTHYNNIIPKAIIGNSIVSVMKVPTFRTVKTVIGATGRSENRYCAGYLNFGRNSSSVCAYGNPASSGNFASLNPISVGYIGGAIKSYDYDMDIVDEIAPLTLSSSPLDGTTKQIFMGRDVKVNTSIITIPSDISVDASGIAPLLVAGHLAPCLTPDIHNSVLNMYSKSSTATFDLTSAEQAISTTPGVNFEYYISQADAIAGNGNTILKPSVYISGNATIYVRVQLGSSFKVTELRLNIHTRPSRKNTECPVQFSWTGPITFSAGNTKAHGTIGTVGYTFKSDQAMIETNGIQHSSSFPASYGVPNNSPSIGNTTISNNNLIFDEPMDGILLVFSSIGNPGLSVPIVFDKPVQVIWSQNVTVNSPNQITGTEGNAIVKVLGVHDSISFHYTQSENYASFTFGANNTVNCVDSDGDGLLDVDDLDDDNDGILDSIECSGNEIVANGKFTNNANGWTLGQGWTSTGSAIEIVENHVLDSDVNQSLTNLRKTNNFIPLSLTLGAQDASQAAGSTASLQILLNNVVYATINNSVTRNPSVNNITMTLANGATSNFTPFSTASISGFTIRNFTINIPNSNIPDTSVLTFRAHTESDDWLLDDISVKAFTCDTDGDGVFDHLDLDSDNDGCLDSVEGDENVSTNQLVNAGGIVTSGPGSSAPNKNICQNNSCIDAQGVPLLVNLGGSADIGNDQGQGLGSSQDPDINPCFCEIQITGDLSFCKGSSTVLTATAEGTGNTFSWSNGVNGPVNTITAGGVYTVTVTNSLGVQCEVSVTVVEHSNPTIQNAI
ncbi:hypothetical protein J7E44_23280, partial [Chryseobacterium sp. ISL-6]|nr:hypothetical protein [Chryseobacterium sp. ISL-6]